MVRLNGLAEEAERAEEGLTQRAQSGRRKGIGTRKPSEPGIEPESAPIFRAPSPESRGPDIDAWDDMVLVGVVARCHGLQGHVIVNPHTDFVEQRFSPGAALWTRRDGTTGTLTVVSARLQGGRPVIGFAGIMSIEQAEGLLGCELRIPERALQPLEENAYYRHQLVGCEVEMASGAPVGRVGDVVDGPGGSLLSIDGGRGEVLVPLATEICVTIDVAARRIVIAPPEGLLELNAAKRPDDRN